MLCLCRAKSDLVTTALHYLFLVFLFIVISSLIFPPLVEAAEIVSGQKATSPKEDIIEDKEKQKGDRNGKQVIYDSAVDFANWIDDFFGEREGLESATYDYLRFVNSIGWREGAGVKYRPRLKVKVHLPRINRKLSLLIDDDGDVTSNQLETNQTDNLFLDDSEDSQTSAAVNYESEEYNGSRFSTRVGLESSFDTFALIKHTMPVYDDPKLQIRNTNYFFWKSDEGIGVNPRLELDRIIDERKLFRWKFSILHSEKSEGNEWRNRFSVVNRFSDTSWISYDMDINGASAQASAVETYRLALRYRRQLSVKWLYLEIEPEFLWQRTPEFVDRKFIPGLILRLEVQLED